MPDSVPGPPTPVSGAGARVAPVRSRTPDGATDQTATVGTTNRSTNGTPDAELASQPGVAVPLL
ncbi:MAG: hypothetical protein ACJ740_07970, partial [Gaiellales bacterium]